METQRNPEEQRVRELANRWHRSFEKMKEEWLARPETTLDDLVDLYWDGYILGRIAPLDQDEKDARATLKKDVWAGTRDDKELYERILYSILNGKEALGKNLSAISPGYAAGAVMDSMQIVYRKFLHQLPKAKYRSEPDVHYFADKFVEKARQEFVRHGGQGDKLLRVGSHGRVGDILVTVEGITPDGKVWLVADNPGRDYMRLYDTIQSLDPDASGTAILASKLDLASFTNPELPSQFSTEIRFTFSRRTNHNVTRSISQDLEAHGIPVHLVDLRPVWDRLFLDKKEGDEVQAKIIFSKEDGMRCEVSGTSA